MLATSKLKFQYSDGPTFEFPDIVCGNGEHLLILGESGKGKTTLLHLLAGMLKPTSGKIEINNTQTSSLSDSALDKFRGQHIGIIFQTAHFVNSLNVLDNLMLAPFLSGKSASKEQALSALKRLNVDAKVSNKPSDLSVGEQQRVAIARAIFNSPSVILADEPTSALDDKNAEEVIAMLEEQADLSGASLIIVTHDKRLKDRFIKKVSL
jgi:ABC-type lipoprotein export system ATPase subunit